MITVTEERPAVRLRRTIPAPPDRQFALEAADVRASVFVPDSVVATDPLLHIDARDLNVPGREPASERLRLKPCPVDPSNSTHRSGSYSGGV